MRATTFAAVYLGTYDVTLEIFEISVKRGIRSIDKIRKHLEIATDTYATGKIRRETVEALCDILKDLVRIMNGYQVEAVRVLAGSSIREAENSLFVIETIEKSTGLKVESLSNSEQRFLSFKAIASFEPEFNRLIEEGCAIIDVGGGSIQISLFREGELKTTLNLRIGSLRTRDALKPLRADLAHYETLVEEFISHELHTFRRIHLENEPLKNVILNGDFITETLFRNIEKRKDRGITRTEFDAWYHRISSSSDAELAMKLNVPVEFESIARPTAILYHKFVEEIGAEKIYAEGVTLSRGLAYEYAGATKGMRDQHDFAGDIISAARLLARRYAVERPHVDNVEESAMSIFQALKREYRLTERDRLLLKISVLLHEVGKYISLNNNGDCAREIIMNNEIIGLAHKEREMVALIAKYNTVWFPRYEAFHEMYSVGQRRYLKIAQLTSILRMANELDRSHRQKVQKITSSLKNDTLTIRVSVNRPFELEKGLVQDQFRFFSEVFNVKANLKVKQIL